MKGDSITVELAVKAADLYHEEVQENKKKNIYLEKSITRDPVFAPGSLVLISFDRPVAADGRRQSLVWKGPYTVVSKSLSGMYTVRDSNGEVHEHAVERLKPFKIADLKI